MNQVHGREGLPKPLRVRARYLKSAIGEHLRDFNMPFADRPFVAGVRYTPANVSLSAGLHFAKTVEYTSIKQRTG
jgi:glutathione S-transferase